MGAVNLRQAAYFALVGLRGQPLGSYYRRILREDREGIPPDTTKRLLVQLLTHCRQSVPYYARVMQDLGDSFHEDPEAYLKRFPILTKATIRTHFDALKSDDLARRKWYVNSSGGSTGKPIELIQDRDYAARAGAMTLLYSKLAGREVGECEVWLWGSMRDVFGGTKSLRARLVDKLTNTTVLSVYRLGPGNMRTIIDTLNAKRPKQITAYAGDMYEVAKFAESEGLEVAPQTAIITSAVTLYPFMRDTIERVFQCRVFNRYGSREVGDIACERPGCRGLWVAPWGNYIEVVDREGNRVPDGTQGDILVTSLTNYAMPMVRYRIEDRGVLAPPGSNGRGRYEQVLDAVLGRSYDMFINRRGTLIEAGHFMLLLYFRDWVSKYQVVQKSDSHIEFRIVKAGSGPPPAELDEISARVRVIMRDDVKVTFQFADDIVASDSGKFRFIISEVNR
jgi:phenylacetate-CoA ligase